jgi:DNA-directed RNA polymerase subunit N
MVPVRCFSCGKVLAHLYKPFHETMKEGKNPEEALDELGVKRYCCRRMLLSHVELIDEIMKYKV